jgi:hypothetical protein
VKRNIDQQLQELEGKLQLLDEDLRLTRQETWKKLITLKSRKECEIETLHALGIYCQSLQLWTYRKMNGRTVEKIKIL